MTIPIWIYAVVVGIAVSALMAIKTGREERQLELENIEQEGKSILNAWSKKRKCAGKEKNKKGGTL